MSMNERYEPQSIESRWQKRWAEARTFAAGRRPEAEKRYVLEMFPYPSGAMHMGHARVYTIGDVLARFLRMRGYDVLHPIGFDALGLPAENAAIKDGMHPAARTRENIVSFRAEMRSLGYAFDWDREIVTADPGALLQGLDELTGWPERVTTMQRNWIGRSEGAEVDFPVAGTDQRIKVFTTRLDTIFGCTYVVLAPEHPLVAAVTRPERQVEVRAFTGAEAVNPFTGQRLPVWIANFVLAEYGTGAVMSVPAHDQRDFEFARKYGLPVKTVIQPVHGGPTPAGDRLQAATTEDGVLADSGRYVGLPSAEARRRMSADAKAQGFGAETVRWHLRDWGFSRQRYWGTPIPIIYCEEHGAVPVPLDQLPVKLPDQAIITGTGEPPLAKVPEFVNTTCPICARPARRETETMDTFVDSAWYYARYLSPKDDQQPFDPKLAERWLPIDVYVGGPEHAVMHLLYFRFWNRVMHELGLVPSAEPCRRLVTQGIVNGPDGRKMSKRWGNVVAPGPIVKRFGADTVRMFMLFAAPPEKDIDWSDEQVDGLFRFLSRVWRIFHARQACFAADEAALSEASGPALELRRRTHRTIRKVTDGLETDLKLNTGIAALMELVNELYALVPTGAAEQAAVREALLALATLLAPFAPHVAEELWHEVRGPAVAELLLAEQPWPAFDPALVAADTVTIAVQVNGKLRG